MAFEWGIDRTCLPPLPDLPDTPTEDQQKAYDAALARQNAAEDIAVHVMWALSGRQFGLNEVVVRPCPPAPFEWLRGIDGYVLTLDAGHWAPWPCGCLGGCEVGGPSVVHLPGPVHDVTAVTVAGVALDAGAYVLEGDALYRRDGVWPSQNLGRPLGDPGTWSVTYRRGIPVPSGVDKLTGVVALEFINACDADGDECRIPRTLTQTTRRGVTHTFDPAPILAAGKTGLPEVDLWLAAVNPHHLAEGPVVL